MDKRLIAWSGFQLSFKTKTKVITLVNGNSHKLPNEAITTRSTFKGVMSRYLSIFLKS